jgi:hypothetical protein
MQEALRSAVGELLRELSELKIRQPNSKQLDFFVLRIVEGKSSKEVAQRLGVVQGRVTELAETGTTNS